MMSRLTGVRQVIKYINISTNKITRKIEHLNDKIVKKTEGTTIGKWINYWKYVFIDYKDAVVDLAKDVREKPVKATCILSLFGAVVYCGKNNPNEMDFKAAYISYANELLLVHPNLQNQISSSHLQFIERCYNQHKIRRLTIGVASIMWVDYHSDSCDSYKVKCPYLQVQLCDFKDQVLDIGFLNHWYVLNDKMIDYDINY